MQIGKPIWTLKSKQCDYCDIAAFQFFQCPSCGLIILICAECGSARLIENLKPGKEVGESPFTTCHLCFETAHNQFQPASADAIAARGFKAEDFA
jgi:hypothetical protein